MSGPEAMLPTPVAIGMVRHRGHPGIVEESPYSHMAPPAITRGSDPTEAAKKKRPTKIADRSLIFGSGGRTRTCDLRVMSPTSCQLLHPALVHNWNSKT